MKAAGVPAHKLTLIPTFVNQRVENTPSRIDDLVVYAGRLEFQKGVHVLVEAIGVLKERFPEVGWTFKVAGDGQSEYVKRLQDRVQELGLSDRIQFIGNLGRNDVSDLLASAQLHVLPALWFENLPNALLEGYAAGTPAIGSDLGSLRAAIIAGQTVFLFKPGDPVALADRLVACWESRNELRKLGARARALAETDYSESRHVDRLVGLFEALRNDAAVA
jgi:glycosyltransferase involved in cell wall biosynthesis